MTKAHPHQDLLEKMLAVIRTKPGIRPWEIHRILDLEHSAPLRNNLNKRGLVRKKRSGSILLPDNERFRIV